MKLTKYGHACVFIENDSGQKIVIDAGEFTELPENLDNIVAVVCTHVHGDHTHAPNIQKIIDVNPQATVFATPESMEALTAVECVKTIIDQNFEKEIADFQLSFYFMDHAVIWQTPPCKNIAVKVDDFYYYPGDSFHVIDESVKIAGLPVSAPWLKMSEVIQFMQDVKSEAVVPVHNGLLNETGHMITQNWLQNTAASAGKKLVILANSESV
jgi:L-ascorbate metabolism protein UlaG (beta-lactamase superfamily)